MSPKTLAYEKLANDVRQKIVSGELEEGDRIPAEVRLATEMSVSRSTVRESLRTLEEEGYIERSSPKIFVVRRRWNQRAAQVSSRAMKRVEVTMNDLFEGLLAIEPAIARIAASRADAKAIDDLKQNLALQEESVDDYQRWCQLDEEFHLEIALSTGNPALIIARAPIVEMISPVYHRFPDGNTVATRAIDFHDRIVRAIEESDPEAAALMSKRHALDSRVPWEEAGVDFDVPVTELGEDLRAKSEERKPVKAT